MVNFIICKKANKAKNSLRFIRRNVKTHNKQLKEAAYRTYVCPQVEYCSTIWHPWQKHLTHRIEMVQRSAARYVQNDYCEIILFRGVFNYVEFVGKTIHELKYQRTKIPSVRFSNAILYLLVNHVNIWYEPRILQVCNTLIIRWFNSSDSL